MVVPPDPKLSAPANRVLLVLGQTPFPVELIDEGCRVLYCNVAYAETFLGKASQVLDRPSRVFPTVFADGQTRETVLEQVIRDGLWKGEVRVQTAAKTELAVRLQIFPIHEPGGGPSEFSVFYEDITEEVHARESLVHQQNLVAIRSRQAQMGELLSMIAHQWRQPLTVVSSLIGNIQLKAQLGGPVDPDYLKVKLDRVAQTVQFLSETIDSFRNFHAPSKHRTVEDLVELTKTAVDLVAPSLAKVGAEVEIVVPRTPVPARVFRGEYQQLVLELVNNARDAVASSQSAVPKMRIEVTLVDDQAVLRVGNNGQTILPSVLPHVFEPYYSTKDSSVGSGLGLYMAKTIVENHHGGHLSAASSPEWTCFTALFPRESS